MSGTTIEHLPECIVIHILSFLPTVDAIRSTITFRSWRNLWFHLPSLSFDIVPIHSPSNPYWRTRKLFFKIVNQAISIRPFFPLKRVHLRFDCDFGCNENYVDSWILHAINSKVSELDLNFDVDGLNSIITESRVGDEVHYESELLDYYEYVFKFSYLKNSTVECLKLRRCEIDFPSNVCTSDFASIRSLFLDDFLKVDEVTPLIQNCVNLEDLTLHYSSFPSDLKILSHKLRKCELSSIFRDSNSEASFEIYAPNLHSIILEDVCFDAYCFKEVPDLVEAQVTFWVRNLDSYYFWCHLMSSLTNIKYLSVQNMYFRPQEMFERFGEEWDASQSYIFNKLTHLDLQTGYSEAEVIGICSFLQHCGTLESLTIDHCYYSYSEENNTEEFMILSTVLHIPRLRQVKMKNHRGCKGENYMLELLKTYQVILEEVVAFPAPIGELESMPFSLWTAPDHKDTEGLSFLHNQMKQNNVRRN